MVIQKIKYSRFFVKNELFVLRDDVYYMLDAPDNLLLNSFYLDDINAVKQMFVNNHATSALKKYLGLTQQSGKCNILDNIDQLEQLVSPQMMPKAKWPGKGNYP